VHAVADDDPENRGGFVLTVAIADVAHYVTPGSALDREALDSRQFGLFPRPRRADAARAHLQRSVLAAPERRSRSALAVRMVIDGNGRKARITLSIASDALGTRSSPISRRRPQSTASPTTPPNPC
jgi:ribonuclease R